MRELKDILEEYKNIRESYNSFITKGDQNKSALLEFERRFVNLKSDLQPFKSNLTGEYGRVDDKAATARKARIMFEIYRGTFTDDDGVTFEKSTLSVAEKLAPATKKYEKFIEERAFIKESLNSISDVREDLQAYVNLVKDQLK